MDIGSAIIFTMSAISAVGCIKAWSIANTPFKVALFAAIAYNAVYAVETLVFDDDHHIIDYPYKR